MREEYPILVRVPLVRAGKIPLVHRWSTLPPDSPVWRDTFAEHPGCNVGIRLDHFVVADCDSEAAVAWWLAECPVGTPLGSMGRPGRMALWYRRSSDSDLRTCRIRPDLEVRTGPGAQQVVPPSIHPCGATYNWVKGQESTLRCLPAAPEDWILAQRSPVDVSGPGGTGWDVVETGGRDNELTSLAGYLRSRGRSEQAIYRLLQAANQLECVPPKSEADIKRIAHSVGRYDAGGGFEVVWQ